MSTPNSTKIVKTVNLNELATSINEKHEMYRSKADSLIRECALDVGKDLICAKKNCKHGNWAEWVNKNLSFSIRTASKYMKYAREMRKLGRGSESEGLPAPELKLLEDRSNASTELPSINSKTRPKPKIRPTNGHTEKSQSPKAQAPNPPKPTSKLKSILKDKAPNKEYSKAINDFQAALEGDDDMDFIRGSFSQLKDASNQLETILSTNTSCLDNAIEYIKELEQYINSL